MIDTLCIKGSEETSDQRNKSLKRLGLGKICNPLKYSMHRITNYVIRARTEGLKITLRLNLK